MSALFAGSLAGQSAALKAPGILRGFLEAAYPDQFIVRSNGNEFAFRRDCLTWIERDQQRIAFTGLHPGEHLEIICDRDDSVPHYARVIHVISTAKQRVLLTYANETYRLPRNPIEFLAPRGDLIYSGVVSQLAGDAMTLRTRVDGLKTIFLRADTRYLESGSQAAYADLHPHTRIFVRAGRNLDNEIEAYQIVWGEIMNPK